MSRVLHILIPLAILYLFIASVKRPPVDPVKDRRDTEKAVESLMKQGRWP